MHILRVNVLWEQLGVPRNHQTRLLHAWKKRYFQTVKAFFGGQKVANGGESSVSLKEGWFLVGGSMLVRVAWKLELGWNYELAEPESSCGDLDVCYRYVLVEQKILEDNMGTSVGVTDMC